MVGGHDVAGPEGLPGPPHLHMRRGVEHASNTGEDPSQRRIGRGGGEIVDHRPDPCGGEHGGRPPGEGDDVVAKNVETAAKGRADEATSPRDEHPHASAVPPGPISIAGWVAAHTESLSRKILALCRASTGNDGWK